MKQIELYRRVGLGAKRTREKHRRRIDFSEPGLDSEIINNFGFFLQKTRAQLIKFSEQSTKPTHDSNDSPQSVSMQHAA